MRHFLDIDDLTASELRAVLDLAKRPSHELDPILSGQGVSCVFMKPSLRTRNSMELAIQQLGGFPVSVTDSEVGLDSRETVEDIGNVLARFHSIIALRVFEHSVLERLADLNLVPIVNLLSDDAHPMQTLADLLTIESELGSVKGKKVVFVGDSNNVARSLVLGVGLLGGNTVVTSPDGYTFGANELARFKKAGVRFEQTSDPFEAVMNADVVYTDVWTSMGQEEESAVRLNDFNTFQVNDELMVGCPEAIVMHDLPAHRGEEITDSVIDGVQSRVWIQAENRLHSARALLYWIAQNSGAEQ